MKPIGIYIHIPFCTKKCPYCDFYSVKPGHKYENGENLIDNFTEALCKEIQNKSKIFKNSVDTIYFGGGTPSLAGIKNINKILNAVYKFFNVLNPEVTIELNPSCHKSLNFLELKETGINRLSIGMQSINGNELLNLGRAHTPFDVNKALFNAKNAGFENISLDVMIATPNQKEKDLLNTLEFCSKNSVSHISVYILKIEKTTRFFKIKNFLSLPNEESTADLYLAADKFLTSKGYKHYEISNFCKNGMESKHNLKYWNSDEYLGFGPSAHSFINGERFFYPRDIKKFIEKPHIILDGEGGGREEYCMLRLRLFEGLKESEYKKRFGEYIPSVFYKRAQKYVNCGLVNISKEGIALTAKGFLLSNLLIPRILY